MTGIAVLLIYLICWRSPKARCRYVRMGFSTVLYISSLFSSERGEFFPISQFISLVLRSSFFPFFGEVSILGDDNIKHCEGKKVSMNMCLILIGYRDRVLVIS